MIRALLLFLLAYILTVILTPIVFIVKLISLRSKDYIWTCAVGFDQAAGSILYGEEDFTISSYTYYLCKTKGKNCWFMKVIDFVFGRNHCFNSYINELNQFIKKLKGGKNGLR